MHVSAVRRNPLTYEHIEPGLVGNSQRILISDLSGRSNVVSKARELGIDLDGESDLASRWWRRSSTSRPRATSTRARRRASRSC